MRRVACKACGVKNEKLAFLSSNTKYTLRFAMQIGGLCRVMTIQDVARLMHLHWHAVRDLDKIYMREQLRVAGDQKPRIIGIDEISIKKGHSYRIVVSDLVARRAIWFGGTGRTEANMDLFYAFLGKQNSRKIKLAVMDMWKPFRVSTQRHAPKAVIMFDKFHIVKHLGDALDAIRRSEYKRVTGEDRSFIKGQRYVLLSRRENLTDDRRKNLERLLQANARLNIAYLLREQFEQLGKMSRPRARTGLRDSSISIRRNSCSSMKRLFRRTWRAAMVGRRKANVAARRFPSAIGRQRRSSPRCAVTASTRR